MKKFFKENWMFLLFVVPFALICIQNKTPENDIWFLLNNGKYIFAHGLPHVDPFTIHDGLSLVMHQWLTSALFWVLFSTFKKTGIIVMIYIMSIVLMYCHYKLLYTVSKNKKISILLTAIAFSLMPDFIVTRPQIFTYLILISELTILEKYIKKADWKVLILLPFLSVLLSNLHAAMWFFQFIFFLPFLLNTIRMKGITIDKVSPKPLLITMILMGGGGLLNPYGVGAITYIFKSYGFPVLSESIKEMRPLTFDDNHFKIIACLLFGLLCIMTFRKDVKLDIRHFLFLCGTTILGFMHLKGYPYFILLFSYCMAYIYRQLKWKKIHFDKYLKALGVGCKMGLLAMLPVTFILTVYYSVTNYDFQNGYIGDIGGYLSDNYVKEDIILYVDYDNGGYTEYLGIKSFIDPRAELFFKKMNGKRDIYLEYYALKKNKDFDFDAFIKNYRFTHLIVDVDSNLDDYMASREDFEVVFTQASGYRKLYVAKDL